MSNPKDIKFFLGSNTKHGFIPLFDELRDPMNGYRLYILKGGPGSGKSSLMRRIAKALEELGHYIEYIPCASDPHSLDAIIDYDANISMVDGTAPHILDPKYPGAYDLMINLGDAWDNSVLQENKIKIIELSDVISQCHSMATSCITSAAALLDNNRSLAMKYVNHIGIQKHKRQIENELRNTPLGKEHKRLLSAISVGNVEFFEETVTSLCTKLYLIPDDWGAASNLLLSGLHDYALSNNLDFITCYCSVHTPEKIDHLLFPSAKIGIVTSNSFHRIKSNNYTSIEGIMNPINSIEINTMINHLSTAQQMVETACSHVELAKQLHDDLETFYINAMDFSKIDIVYEKVLNDILRN